MAFAVPVWLAVQEQLLAQNEAECGASSCFDTFDDEALFQLFNLSRPCILFIADAVRIRMKDAAPKKSQLPVDEMVMVALNYYAHGVSTTAVLQKAGLRHTDCPTTVVGTISGVIAGMSDVFISFPLTLDARTNVALKIEKFCEIPNVLGVLAPAHFKIRASPYEKDAFRSFINALGYTSVVSQIICDCDGNILSVEKCCVGGTFEQEMWDSSFKGREMQEDLHSPFWLIGKSSDDLLCKCLFRNVNWSDSTVRYQVKHKNLQNYHLFASDDDWLPSNKKTPRKTPPHHLNYLKFCTSPTWVTQQ